MGEVTIGGQDYTIGKLDARRAFHVARRLAPVMSAMAGEEGGEPMNALGSMSEALAKMRDEDADHVINSCLSVCQRKNEVHGTGWSPVAASNGRLMFQDIDLPQMMQLVWAVIQENLSSFFSGLPSGLVEGPPQESS